MGGFVSNLVGGAKNAKPLILPPTPAPKPPSALPRVKRRARRGKIGKTTQLTGPRGLGDADVRAASVLGG